MSHTPGTGKKPNRPDVETQLRGLGWDRDRIHRELCAPGRVPKSIAEFPCVDAAVESVLDELSKAGPEHFADFELEIAARLHDAANGQSLAIRDRIADYLRQLGKRWPLILHHEEDLVQQVFQVLVEMPESSWYDTSRSSNWSGWLYGVTCHQAFEHMRKQGFHRRGSFTVSLGDIAEPAAADERPKTTREELRQRIAEECGERNAEIFILTRLDEVPVKKIAAKLGYSVYAIYKRNGKTEDRMRDLGRERFE